MNRNLILLVDDDSDICTELSIFLSKKGYDVIVANNGKDALELFTIRKPILVLTDYMMPGMDGIELLKNIKNRNRDVCVILMSGVSDVKTSVRAMKEDAFDFLAKPVDLKELQELLQSAIKRTESRIATKKVIDVTIYLEHREFPGMVGASTLYFNMPLDEHSSERYNTEFNHLLSENIFNKIIVFDLGSIDYINNVGLNLLIELKDILTERKYKVFTCNVKKSVLNYLNTLGYLNYFNYQEVIDEIILLSAVD